MPESCKNTTIIITLIHEGLTLNLGCIARVNFQGPIAQLESQFKAASRAFVDTEAGRAYLKHTLGDFNWGDALTQIPEETLRRFGIETIEVLTQDYRLVLNHDERLI